MSEGSSRAFQYKKTNVGNRGIQSNKSGGKRGIALLPLCYGIAFNESFLNQANAVVNIYTDGGVGVSSGAVEMGQGVTMRLRQVAAEIFSIALNRIKN